MKKNKHQLIYFHVPCPNDKSAEELGRLCVLNKLAACTHTMPVHSIFEWHGKINQEKELLLILKTTKKKSDELESFIEKNHSYEIPCILKMKGYCNSNYYDWVKQQIKKDHAKNLR